jgi:hypothetical protein
MALSPDEARDLASGKAPRLIFPRDISARYGAAWRGHAGPQTVDQIRRIRIVVWLAEAAHGVTRMAGHSRRAASVSQPGRALLVCAARRIVCRCVAT